MKIIVCIKQVPDPEGPQESFVINHDSNKVEPKGIPPVLSLFDENALEAALRIKDKDPDNVQITVLSMGKKVSNAVMLKALAAGADELVKVEDGLFELVDSDSLSTAKILTSAIRKIGDYDLIIVGRQAADWNAGQAGIGIAHFLGIPAITLAQKVEPNSDHVIVERVLEDGYEIVKAPVPCLIMAGNEVGELRYPAMKERRKAKKKKITAWNATDIDCKHIGQNKIVLKRLFQPRIEETVCEMIEGETPAEAGKMLAKRLTDRGIV